MCFAATVLAGVCLSVTLCTIPCLDWDGTTTCDVIALASGFGAFVFATAACVISTEDDYEQSATLAVRSTTHADDGTLQTIYTEA